MAKTKTKSSTSNHTRKSSKDILRSTTAPLVNSPKNSRSLSEQPQRQEKSIEDLLTAAASLLEQSQPDLALPLAEEALRRLENERKASSKTHDDEIDCFLQQATNGKPTLPTALTLGADIYLAIGDAESAEQAFTKAILIDPDGALISAEPCLWMAQLNQSGGRESIKYFEKAVEIMRNEIEVLEEAMVDEEGQGDAAAILEEKKLKLADALCGMAEVYMTDLSWDDDAEIHCERFVTEAIAVCPERLSAGVLQTLASVRISQERFEDARQALKRSMTLWKDLTPEEMEDEVDIRPDFASRISLSRLLMEVEAEEDAIIVLEGLIKEDDQSVECWYLGGWCHVLISQKGGPNDESEDTISPSQEQALQWLNNCLRLYRLQDYEDVKLRDHAFDLKTTLQKTLHIEEDEADENLWEDEEDDLEDDENEIQALDVLEDRDVEMKQ